MPTINIAENVKGEVKKATKSRTFGDKMSLLYPGYSMFLISYFFSQPPV